MAMEIYSYDQENGNFIGVAEADGSPLEPGVFLIPANATTLAPPAILDGQVARFSNDQWVVETIPVAAPATPAVPTLDDVKRLKIADIDGAAAGAIAPITSVYSQAERDTWPIQEAEAAAWSANSQAPTPLLSALAEQRALTMADLVTSVQTKAAAFKALAGATFGKRRALVDQVSAAATAEAVALITW
jgi:hypothetical protein